MLKMNHVKNTYKKACIICFKKSCQKNYIRNH